MNELLESEEAPLPQAALQQWLQKLDVGWNKLLEMWESRREVLVQAHIFHLFLRDVKQAESFLNNQVMHEKVQQVVGRKCHHLIIIMVICKTSVTYHSLPYGAVNTLPLFTPAPSGMMSFYVLMS